MFSGIGITEIFIILILVSSLLDAKDLAKAVRTARKLYNELRNRYYQLRAELLYEPPTAEELKARKETEEFYRKYGEGYDPYAEAAREPDGDAAEDTPEPEQTAPPPA